MIILILRHKHYISQIFLYIFPQKIIFLVVRMFDPTHFNPDGKSLVELAFLFENEVIAQHLHEYLWRTNNDVNGSNCFRKAIELISFCNYY